MKTRNITLMMYLTAVFGMLFMLVSNSAVAGTITGSKHDFQNSSFTVDNQICVVCHTPHGSDTAVTEAPLWHHETTTKTYTVYSSNSLDATVGDPDGISKLCLSCHDGSVALDSFGGVSGAIFMTDFNPDAAVGADVSGSLANDHPISFVYNQQLATDDGALHDPTTKTVTIGSGTKTKSGTIDTVMLSGGKVQCSTCHDVHNTFTVPNSPLLRVSLTGSSLCLTCHDK